MPTHLDHRESSTESARSEAVAVPTNLSELTNKLERRRVLATGASALINAVAERIGEYVIKDLTLARALVSASISACVSKIVNSLYDRRVRLFCIFMNKCVSNSVNPCFTECVVTTIVSAF